MTPVDSSASTQSPEYRDRLVKQSRTWWKRLVPVQAPYRFNVRRLCPGRTLEIGCGIGRSLRHLGNGKAVGVDHNAASVATAQAAGLEAYEPKAFEARYQGLDASFDHLLLAHVAEHVSESVFMELVKTYLPYLKTSGSLVIITPQEKGYDSDPTHVRFVDFPAIQRHVDALGFKVEKSFSFPFARVVGRLFPYNEFVVSARRRPSTRGK